MDSNSEKINKLAREILDFSRNTLLVNLRFMNSALSQLEYAPMPTETISTDGKYIFYNPVYILKCYKKDRGICTRAYLHMVLHCVFRHMFMNPALNPVYWNLATDIAVESIISELSIKATLTEKEIAESIVFEEFKGKIKKLTAEKIYRYLITQNLTEEKINELKELFTADNHNIWYKIEEEKTLEKREKTDTPPQDKENKSDNSKQENSGEKGESHSSQSNSTPQENQSESENDDSSQGDNSSSEKSDTKSETEKTWKEISERIEMDLETFAREQGEKANGLKQNLITLNRKKYDYVGFLKKFAVKGETMKVNDDEFDYIYYTYGLQQYKNVPLIEPLEYKEVKKIRDFAIVIDTSGSTSGELVKKFIQKTFNILKSSESFFRKINIHIIQCDEKIQDDKIITSQADFDEYIKNMQLYGFGGTDFRPAFAYVDKLIKNKEFTNLKGLIYFTDGEGTFPQRKPDYMTAFVFLDDDGIEREVPDWAIKIILNSDEI